MMKKAFFLGFVIFCVTVVFANNKPYAKSEKVSLFQSYSLSNPSKKSEFFGNISKKEFLKLLKKEIGGGYTVIDADCHNYSFKKGGYTYISEFYEGKKGACDRLIVKNKKGKEIFKTKEEGLLKGILIGKKEFYYLWENKSDERILYRVSLPSGKRSEIFNGINEFGAYLNGKGFEKTKTYYYKNRIYFSMPEGEGLDGGVFIFNTKNRNPKIIDDHLIKDNKLYYTLSVGDISNLHYLKRTELDGENEEHLGSFELKELENLRKINIWDVDNKYIYYFYRDKSNSGRTAIEKFKLDISELPF